MLLNKFISFNYYIKITSYPSVAYCSGIISRVTTGISSFNQDPVVRSPISSSNPGFFFFFQKHFLG